jgi:KaiC/GvpD/RAD55 family RecA-like ATPase
MKIATDIPGFDAMINGGFEDGTANLVAGEAGTCKSIFCIQFLYNRAKKYKEDVYYITTEDCTSSIIKQADRFGWKLMESPIKERFNLVRIEPYNLTSLMKFIAEIKDRGVKCVVIDSVSLFEVYLKEPFSIRKSLFSIIDNLREEGRVTLVTGEIPQGSKALSRSEIIEFVADSVIRLHYIQAAKSKRSITVKKMRFSSHAENAHPFKITSKGISVM